MNHLGAIQNKELRGIIADTVHGLGTYVTGVEPTGGNHLKIHVFAPDGGEDISFVLAKTPSDYRGMKNCASVLKRLYRKRMKARASEQTPDIPTIRGPIIYEEKADAKPPERKTEERAIYPGQIPLTLLSLDELTRIARAVEKEIDRKLAM